MAIGGLSGDQSRGLSAPLLRQSDLGTNRVAHHFAPTGRRPAEGDAHEDFMSNADNTARLRELVRLCRRSAEHSYELEAKASFRTIAEGLSTMADEIERGANRGGATHE
jgi:hypothetical protein